jgi:hypothetical protein
MPSNTDYVDPKDMNRQDFINYWIDDLYRKDKEKLKWVAKHLIDSLDEEQLIKAYKHICKRLKKIYNYNV